MTSDSERDDRGRFGPGNPGGPGRPRGRAFELQRAAEEAITPEHIAAMFRKALRLALEGNLAAMRFVAERVLGRAAEATIEAEPIAFAMPNLRTAASCAAAIDRLAAAVTAGTIPLNAAKVMLDLVHARMKAIDLNNVETRLVDLERAARAIEERRGRTA